MRGDASEVCQEPQEKIFKIDKKMFCFVSNVYEILRLNFQMKNSEIIFIRLTIQKVYVNVFVSDE